MNNVFLFFYAYPAGAFCQHLPAFPAGAPPIIAWTVYDAAGREVLHGKLLAASQCTIDIAAQPAGVYLLKVYTENGMYDTRLLKY